MGMTEHELQTEILKRYGSRPDMRLWRMNTGAAVGVSAVRALYEHGDISRLPITRYGVKGQPDLLGLRAPSGQWISIEVKSERGKQTPEQKVWQQVIESLGGIYILARSIEDVEKGLCQEKQ